MAVLFLFLEVHEQGLLFSISDASSGFPAKKSSKTGLQTRKSHIPVNN